MFSKNRSLADKTQFNKSHDFLDVLLPTLFSEPRMGHWLNEFDAIFDDKKISRGE